MKKYYLHDGNQQQGPFDISELKSKNISPKTEVWLEGSPDWVMADTVEELRPLFRETLPPPIKNKVATSVNKPSQRSASIKILKNLLPILLISGALIIVIIYIVSAISNNDNSSIETYNEKKMTIGEIETADPVRFLRAEGNYNESFWGTELKIRGTIINNATVTIYKDITLMITYYSKTKSVILTKNYILYEIYPPTSTTPFKLDITNYENVTSIDWKVISALPN